MFDDVAGRRRLAVLALVAAVLLAGCGGGIDGTTTTEQPTTTTATTTTAAESVDLDGDELRRDHVTALDDAGSFEANFRFAVSNRTNSAEAHYRTRLDTASDRSLMVTNVTVRNQRGSSRTSTTQFSNSTGTYQQKLFFIGGRTSSNYDAAYPPYENDSLRPVNETRAAFASSVESAARVDWRRAGTTTYRGATVTEYRATTPSRVASLTEQLQSTAAPSSRIETVDTANATLYVGDSGAVRYYHVKLVGTTDGDSRQMELRLRVDGLGDAPVESPDWTEKAANRTATDGSTSA